MRAAPASAGSRIDIRGVGKDYAGVTALSDVSLDIRAGEFLTLLGASGSGKTTLLMILAGFVRPTRGSVRFGDREMVDEPPHRRNVGMVFQNYALFPHMNVRQNIEFPLKLRKMPPAERAARAAEVERLVALEGYHDRGIDALSGGQRQRVALARAIAYSPPILLMDEPLSALDKNLRETMQLELRRLHERLGRTTVYVTHDQREALTMSDRIAILDQGRVVQVDTPKVLYERPNSRFVAGFLGEASFLILDIRAGRVMLGPTAIRSEHMPVGIEGRALLAIRPEKLALLDPKAATGEFNQIPTTVKQVVYQGDSVMLTLLTTTGEIVTMRQATRADIIGRIPVPGEAATVGLHPADALILPAAT